MAGVTLKRGSDEKEFSQEHAENILNSSVNEKVKKELKYTLPKGGDWVMKDGKLVKKKK